MLFVKGANDNLLRCEQWIDQFYKRSWAKINWHKSKGLWIETCKKPPWCPDSAFCWLSENVVVWYLEFWIGIKLDKQLQIESLKQCIKNKIRLWSTTTLSLARRVLIVNQVLASTLSHTLSCCIWDKTELVGIKRDITWFLWTNKTEGNITSKVVWSTITRKKKDGDLGLIDPKIQNMALMGKFVVRGLTLGEEMWKSLCWQKLNVWKPRVGGKWRDTPCWRFIKELNMKTLRLLRYKLNIGRIAAQAENWIEQRLKRSMLPWRSLRTQM